MNRYARMMLLRNGSRDEHERKPYERERWDERNYPENRFRDRTGREHYDNGRFAPQSRYIPKPYYYDDEYMRPIGFHDDESRMDGVPYIGDYRSEDHGMGYARGRSSAKMDKATAEEWMRHLKNADGTTGAHWTLEQTTQVMQQHGMKCDPIEFWVAMNAEYSDRCKVNEKHGMNNITFYADSAKAFWLDDSDAVQNKECAYYDYVVKH